MMLLSPVADAQQSRVSFAVLSAATDLEREATDGAKRIETVLRALAPTWNAYQRWSTAYEMDDVFEPHCSLRANARRFYGVLPDTPALPRPHRAFIAFGVATALGALHRG